MTQQAIPPMTSAPRRGLGRGLGALIPSATAGDDRSAFGDPGTSREQPAGTRRDAPPHFAELPVDAIQPNPRQPRQVFDEDAMAELIASIGQVGLLQPVVVRPLGNGSYQLVMGERRWRATRAAGHRVIPAIVRETQDEAMLRNGLLENLHRAQLNPLEEAAAYQQLLDDFNCTQEELSGRIGRSRPQISNTLRLLKLSPPVQRRVAAGVLSAGHARTLLAVAEPEAQDRLATRVIAEGISVRGLEELVALGQHGESASAAATAPSSGPPGTAGSPAVADQSDLGEIAERLGDYLDTRVRIEAGRSRCRITIDCAPGADLHRVVSRIDPGFAQLSPAD